jgi:hypothetical protein
LLAVESAAENYSAQGIPGLEIIDQSRNIVYVRQSAEGGIDVRIAVQEIIRAKIVRLLIMKPNNKSGQIYENQKYHT